MKNIKITKKKILITTLLVASIVGGFYYFHAPTPISIETQLSGITQFPDTIVGNIVTLKKLSTDHAFAYHLMFSPDVRKNLGFPTYINFAYTSRYVAGQVEKLEKGLLIAYAIFDNKKQTLIGAIQIREPNPNDPGQLGMWINEKYRGGGRIKEALEIICKAYFIVKKDTQKFTAHVEIWNNRSYCVLIRAGFHDIDRYYENDEITRYILELYRDDVLQN